MAVGVVSLDPITKPKHLFGTKKITEPFFNILPGERGIAVGVQKAGLRGQQSPLTIRINRTALQDEPGLEQKEAVSPSDLRGNDIIQIIWRILPTPCVVAEIVHRKRWFSGSRDKNGSMITTPRLIGGDIDELNILHGCNR